jgi:hypothetical protein
MLKKMLKRNFTVIVLFIRSIHLLKSGGEFFSHAQQGSDSSSDSNKQPISLSLEI